MKKNEDDLADQILNEKKVYFLISNFLKNFSSDNSVSKYASLLFGWQHTVFSFEASFSLHCTTNCPQTDLSRGFIEK